ncbi:unnamed protein product [Brugia pahangi]|uniref:CC domain-containing protein n=1 Tax=Brugia pahangi TaxID=6280 RepID=A0A0N4SYX3_BRUPA|nr:unnamed protein product [Brugia pahangi]
MIDLLQLIKLLVKVPVSYVPQQCPYGGEVIGLGCDNSKSCECLAQGLPVLCVQRICCAYRLPNYFPAHFT